MKPNASGMPGIVRSDSYGDLAYDFAAYKLVTTFKERVTIFGTHPPKAPVTDMHENR